MQSDCEERAKNRQRSGKLYLGTYSALEKKVRLQNSSLKLGDELSHMETMRQFIPEFGKPSISKSSNFRGICSYVCTHSHTYKVAQVRFKPIKPSAVITTRSCQVCNECRQIRQWIDRLHEACVIPH